MFDLQAEEHKQPNNIVDIARAVVQSLAKLTVPAQGGFVGNLRLSTEDASKILAIALGTVIFDATTNNKDADRAIDSLVESIKQDMYSMRQAMQADMTINN